MAPKKQNKKPAPKAEVKKAIKQASSGGVTKQELQQISKQTGSTAQQIVQQMDIINKNVKQAGGQPTIALNSGAANMLIKQMEKATPQMLGYQQPNFGGGQIGKTLQGMMGSSASGGYINPQSGQQSFTAAVPSQMMIGGTMIRPGGRVAINPMAFAGGAGSTSGTGGAGPYNTGNMPLNTGTNDVGPLAPGTTGGNTIGGDQLDYQSILDAIAGIQQPQFDMSALTDMFNTQYDQLRSEFATRDPIQLQMIGRNYGGDAIRARQRNRKTARDYRRSSLGIASANPAPTYNFSGGLTL
jgi:hypothetical protein